MCCIVFIAFTFTISKIYAKCCEKQTFCGKYQCENFVYAHKITHDLSRVTPPPAVAKLLYHANGHIYRTIFRIYIKFLHKKISIHEIKTPF